MSRAFHGWVLVGLIALSSGCRMVPHPFDYTGPTVMDEGMAAFGGNAPRAGSILSHSTLSHAVGPTWADGDFVDSDFADGDFVDGDLAEGTILSVEDRLLEDLMEPTLLNAEPVEVAEVEVVAEDEATGWTSRTSRRRARK